MKLNTLKAAEGSRPKGKRVGRGIGSGLGKTCGRGHKGAKSRSGASIPAGFEGGQQPLQRRLGKFGFSSRLARITAEIRLNEVAAIEGDVIDLDALRKANVITSTIKRAKVIASGSIDRAVTIKGLGVTKGAKAAIEAAGGKIEA